jgi:hypothetical protein
VVRARSQDLATLDTVQVQPTVDQILHTAAATKLLDALEDNLLLAPIQSSIVPFLRRNDEVMRRIMNTIEMPDRMAENLVRFIRLNEG